MNLGDTLKAWESPFDHLLGDDLMWYELDSGEFVCGNVKQNHRSARDPWIVLREEKGDASGFSLHYIASNEESASAKAELCAIHHPQTTFYVMKPTCSFRYGDMQVRYLDDD